MRKVFLALLLIQSLFAETDTIEISKEVNTSNPRICDTVTFTIAMKNISGQSQRMKMRDAIETYTDKAADDWTTTKKAFRLKSIEVVNNSIKKINCRLLDDEEGAKYIECDTQTKRRNGFSFTVKVEAIVTKKGSVTNSAHGYFNDWDWQGVYVRDFTVFERNRTAQISIKNAQIAEGNYGKKYMHFTIIASPSPTETITFKYSTINGTAKAGEDYEATSGTATIEPCQNEINISIPIIGDKKFEEDEYFTVKLSNLRGNAEFKKDSAQGTIINDDEKIYNDPYLQLCTVFHSGINTLKSVSTLGINNIQCGSKTIVADSSIGTMLCTLQKNCSSPSACQVSQIRFPTINPKLFSSSRKTPLTDNASGIINADKTDYADALLRSTHTVNFTPAQKYSNSQRKFSTFATFATDGQTITLNFAPGDYYFENLILDTRVVRINLPEDGKVRLFIKNDFVINSPYININNDGDSKNLFIYTRGKFLVVNQGAGGLSDYINNNTSMFGMISDMFSSMMNNISQIIDELYNGNDNMVGEGGIGIIKAYIYSKSKIEFNARPDNFDIYGALTSEDIIGFGGNNYHIHYTGIFNDCGYCEDHGLSAGFHMINPFDDIEKSFEIYCTNTSPKHTLITLPIKNKFNNFVYDSDELDSTDYYKMANEHSKGFEAIEINIDEKNRKIEAVLGNSIEPITIDNIKILRKGFSNINLIGTPLQIDWANSSIIECDTEKLRRGYYNQAIKVNTLVSKNDAICILDHLELKILDDYKYIEYPIPNSSASPNIHNEILAKSCKALSENIPESILPSSQIKGHFWIYPRAESNLSTRTDASSNPTSKDRPFVVYCWYQEDLHNAWTFFLALDGERTITKYDLINKKDTCSQLGLWPFVPNSEKTFERVRKFLKENKNEWINYTGTIEEKVNALYGLHYYLETERDAPIWPYGSFGLYYDDNDGVHEDYFDWGAEDIGLDTSREDLPGPMSGSPMHNIKSIHSDYPHKEESSTRKYYSWSSSNYALKPEQLKYGMHDATPADGTYSYTDTMGAKGWKTILGSDDLNKTDDWFVSRTGAGLNFDMSLAPGDWPYYEPNGNYEEGCWLNFLYDEDGRVRHLDDWGCNYPYYDYMCMAEDNYDFVKRYDLTKGPLSVIDHTVPFGQEIPHKDSITTKIVNHSIDLDVIVMNDARTALYPDRNISVGIFFATLQTFQNNEERKELAYFGELKDYNLSTGRFYLSPQKWPNQTNKWPKSLKKAFFIFKYCGRNDLLWNDCWNPGINGTCKEKPANIRDFEWCRKAESDLFAIRPEKFTLTLLDGTTALPNGTAIAAQKDINISFQALDASGSPAIDYNESNYNTPSFEVNVSIADSSKECEKPTIDINNTIDFHNGVHIKEHSFSDVGKFTITIQEINGSEFAKVDANDTNDSQRLITPYHGVVKIVPDHFDINATLQNMPGKNYTYLSKNLNVAAILDLNITAKGAQNGIMKNYSKSCYAKDNNITFFYQFAPSTPQGLDKLIYRETNTQLTGLASLSEGNFSIEFNNSIFTPDHNGTASLQLQINFDRKVTTPVDPFHFNFNPIKTKDLDDINGSGTPTGGATFYYARIHMPLYKFKGTSGTAKIFYEVYDSSHRDPAGIEGAESEDDINWYVNTTHDSSIGQIYQLLHESYNLLAADSPALHITMQPITNGYHTITMQYKKTKLPYSAHIDVNASNWLIFNKFNSNATYNSIEAIFEVDGNWKGIGNFTQQNEFNKSKTPYNRIEW